jgi:beta-lactam-binding protein with PASTA domain
LRGYATEIWYGLTGGRIVGGVRSRLVFVGVLGFLAVLVLAPAAFAAPTDEPPDVTGRTVADAQLYLRENWYPLIEFVITPAGGKPLPTGTDQSLAVVQKQVLRNKGWSNGPFSGAAAPKPVVEFQIVPKVPDLTELTRPAAAKLAAAYGFTLTVQVQPGTSSVTGVVGTQNPPAGTLGLFGDAIRVQLRPAVSRQVRVPDIRGLAVGPATSTVNALDLQLTVEMTAPGERGPVVGQRPIPGTLVAPGTTVVAVVRPVVVAPTLGPSPGGPQAEAAPDWVPVVLVGGSSVLLALLLLLLLTLLLRRWRRPDRPDQRDRDREPPTPAVTAQPRAGQLYGPTFEPISPAPDRVVAVRPRVPTAPATVFEEVPK